MKGLTFQHLLLGLFAVANNLKALGPFLELCRGVSKDKQQRLVNIATITALITMLLAALTGEYILDFFGISVSAFKITGGLALCISGFTMLNAKSYTAHTDMPEEDFDQKIPEVIVPITIPLTTGAGTISTITIFAQQLHHQHVERWGLLGAILIMSMLIYIFFKLAPWLLKVLGGTGMNVLIKITGLFTLAIGIQFIVDGVIVVFPGLVY